MRWLPLLLSLAGLPTGALADASLNPRDAGRVLYASDDQIHGLATDGRNVYWVSTLDVMAMAIDGGAPRRVARRGDDIASGLVVDERSLYVLPSVGPLAIFPKWGGMRQSLPADGAWPCFAVDDRYLYWLSRDFQLLRVRKAGGAPTVLARFGDGVSGLASDGARVYFQEKDDFRAIPREGGEPVTVARGVPRISGSDYLAVEGDSLYWAAEDGIWRLPKRGGAPARVVATGGRLHGLAVDARRIYWIEQRGDRRVLLARDK